MQVAKEGIEIRYNSVHARMLYSTCAGFEIDQHDLSYLQYVRADQILKVSLTQNLAQLS